MSHPNPLHDRDNEYPSDNYKPIASKGKALKKKMHPIAKSIDALRERKGESPVGKLKRLLRS